MRLRPLAAVLALTLVAASHPALAAAPALLEGAVVAETALAGARVELADRAGSIVASAPVADGGAFRVEAVPAGTYRVAVTTPEGAYAAAQTVTLAPGAVRNVQIAVKQQGQGGGVAGSGDFWATKWGKFTGVALIVGGAFLGAALIDEDEDAAAPPASPSQPTEVR